jgi:hypothetical protein
MGEKLSDAVVLPYNLWSFEVEVLKREPSTKTAIGNATATCSISGLADAKSVAQLAPFENLILEGPKTVHSHL